MFDKQTQKIFYDKLTYIYLEMPKFNKTAAELDTHFDKWLYILKNLEDLTVRAKQLQEKIFQKLFEQAEIANYSDTEYAEYEASLKVYRDLKNVIDTAFSDGIQPGLEQGIKATTLENARKMKQKNFSAEDIADITGLSIEPIKSL